MGKSGSFGGLKPPSFKSAFWADAGNDWDSKTETSCSGVCRGCMQWDTELVDSYCRDDECKKKRQEIAVAQGRAVKIIEGLPNGKTVVKNNKGNTVIGGKNK